MNDNFDTSARGLPKRAIVDGTLSCLKLGIVAGNLIAITLFAIAFCLRLLAA